ncbi:hypothetical protein ACFL0H_07485 [Thermodesulfobacteriota bacterium]
MTGNARRSMDVPLVRDLRMPLYIRITAPGAKHKVYAESALDLGAGLKTPALGL